MCFSSDRYKSVRLLVTRSLFACVLFCMFFLLIEFILVSSLSKVPTTANNNVFSECKAQGRDGRLSERRLVSVLGSRLFQSTTN